MRLQIVVAAAALVLAAVPASAQRAGADAARDDARFSFYERGPYRPGIPRPESMLGYPIGERNTQYAAQERTLLAIADAAKDRVRVEEFTTTYERRRDADLHRVVAGEHRAARRDPRATSIVSPIRAASRPPSSSAIAARTPAVVWIIGIGARQRVARLRDVHAAALPARGERGAGDARGAAQHDRHHQPELEPGRARAVHRVVQLGGRGDRRTRAPRSTTSRGACRGGSTTTAST